MGSSSGFAAKSVVLVDGVDFDAREGFLVASEVVEVIPAHGVHVCLSDFFGEHFVVFAEEGVKILVTDEVLLLYDLGVDVG